MSSATLKAQEMNTTICSRSLRSVVVWVQVCVFWFRICAELGYLVGLVGSAWTYDLQDKDPEGVRSVIR